MRREKFAMTGRGTIPQRLEFPRARQNGGCFEGEEQRVSEEAMTWGDEK
jgi:hypothetical protein